MNQPTDHLPPYPTRLRAASHVVMVGAALWSLSFTDRHWGIEPIWP